MLRGVWASLVCSIMLTGHTSGNCTTQHHNTHHRNDLKNMGMVYVPDLVRAPHGRDNSIKTAHGTTHYHSNARLLDNKALYIAPSTVRGTPTCCCPEPSNPVLYFWDSCLNAPSTVIAFPHNSSHVLPSYNANQRVRAARALK